MFSVENVAIEFVRNFLNSYYKINKCMCILQTNDSTDFKKSIE